MTCSHAQSWVRVALLFIVWRSLKVDFVPGFHSNGAMGSGEPQLYEAPLSIFTLGSTLLRLPVKTLKFQFVTSNFDATVLFKCSTDTKLFWDYLFVLLQPLSKMSAHSIQRILRVGIRTVVRCDATFIYFFLSRILLSNIYQSLKWTNSLISTKLQLSETVIPKNLPHTGSVRVKTRTLPSQRISDNDS